MFENEENLIRPQPAGYMEWPVYPEQRLPGAHVMLGYQPKAANTSSSSSGASQAFRMNENQEAVEKSKSAWGAFYEDVNTLIQPLNSEFKHGGEIYYKQKKGSTTGERVTVVIKMETAKNGDRKLICTLAYKEESKSYGEIYYTELRTMDGFYLYLNREDYKKLKAMEFEELLAYWRVKRGYKVGAKIYLSPADHDKDRICVYQTSCTETIHCNTYIDKLEKHLQSSGFLTKRRPRVNGGVAEYAERIKQANDWPADLYYACHTNGADGTAQGSRPQCYLKSAIQRHIDAKKWSEIVLEWRRKIYDKKCEVHNIDGANEISNTNMPCVYEELVFHDNLEDATFLHNNMDLLAEYTARALCDIFKHHYLKPS